MTEEEKKAVETTEAVAPTTDTPATEPKAEAKTEAPASDAPTKEAPTADVKNQSSNKKLFHYVELLELWLEGDDFHSQQQL